MPGKVWRSAAVPMWLIVLTALDEAESPLTAYACVKRRESQRPTDGRRYLDPLVRHGLAEMLLHGSRWPRFRITPKGREYLREGLREMSDFIRGDL